MNSIKSPALGNQNELSFLEHLEVLRIHLLTALVFFVVAFVMCFIFSDFIAVFLKMPISETEIPLVYMKPQEKLLSYLFLSATASFFCVFPLFAGLVLHFVFPAFEGKDRIRLLVLYILMMIFFYSGAYFGYRVLLSYAVGFFMKFKSGDGIHPLWSIRSYFGMSVSLITASALVFQTPWVLLFFMKSGILPPALLKKARKTAFILSYVISAVISPPDIYSQVIIGTVLYALFELSLTVAGFLKIGEPVVLEKEKGAE